MSELQTVKVNPWKEEFFNIHKLGIPLLLTQILVFAINVIDVVMVGRLGPDSLAAASLGLVLFTSIWLFAAGPAYAVPAIITQIIGKDLGDLKVVRKTIQMGLWVIVSMLPIAVIVILVSSPLLKMFGVEEGLAENATSYMITLAPSFVFSLSIIMFRGFFAAIERTMLPLLIIFCVTLLNVLLNYGFIYGNLGFPRLELVGAGVATSISSLIGFIAMSVYLVTESKSRKYKVFKGILSYDRNQFGEVWALGLPIGIDLLFEVMLFNVFAILMARVGTNEVAAYHIVFNVAQVSYMMILGISMGGATRTGLVAGQGNVDNVRRVIVLTIASCLFITSVFFVPLVTFSPDLLASFYLSEEQVSNNPLFYNIVVSAFPIVALIVLLDALQMGANQCTRALLDAKVPMLLTGFSYWLVGLPIAVWLAFYNQWGAKGLWVGMVIALTSDATLQSLRAFWITRKGSKFLGGSAFRDEVEGITTPEMVIVVPGEYVMGSPEDEAGRNPFSEGEQKEVHIDYAFAVSRSCITFEEYDDFCRERRWTSCGDEGWGRGKRPVINVSWRDAKEYVKWLSRKTGKNYRLLSETEWEYCCRANSTGPFSFGETISTEQANYNGTEAYGKGDTGDFLGKTMECCSYPPNDFGLCDLHGNVWEWVEDKWNEGALGIPTDGSPAVHGDLDRRVLRGGSWYSVPALLRSGNRIRYVHDFRDDDIGFRVSRDL